MRRILYLFALGLAAAGSVGCDGAPSVTTSSGPPSVGKPRMHEPAPTPPPPPPLPGQG